MVAGRADFRQNGNGDDGYGADGVDEACVMRFRGKKGGSFELQIEFGALGGGRIAATRQSLSITIARDEARKLLNILKAQLGSDHWG